MTRDRRESPAIRVYTVCDESKYLIVKNIPSIGCVDELVNLFRSYGEISEYRMMDEVECEPFTEVCWLKFLQVSNARFAKRKLDEYVFFGNRLQVSYAPQYESPAEVKDKLEGRRREVLSRLNSGTLKTTRQSNVVGPLLPPLQERNYMFDQPNPLRRDTIPEESITYNSSSFSNLPSEQYFSSPSMNDMVRLVRDKLDQIQSSSSTLAQNLEAEPSAKKRKADNRRRI